MAGENTYRTILFEEFDKDKPDLATILQDETVTPDGETMKKELEKLTVHSFEEFIDKFAPKFYQNVGQKQDGSFYYTFSLDSNGGTAMDITKMPYFELLKNMYSQKGSSGQANIEFDDKDIIESILPRKIIEKAAKTRKLLQTYAEKFYEAKDKGEPTGDIYKAYHKEMAKVQETYKDKNSFQGLLPLLIDDRKKRIEYLLQGVPEKSGDGDKVPLLGAHRIEMDEDGNLFLKKIEQLPAPSAGQSGSRDIPLLISRNIEKNYDTYAQANGGNAAIKSVIISTFVPMLSMEADYSKLDTPAKIEQEIQKLEGQKLVYENAYQSYIDEFVKTMVPLIEKLFGVYVYFEHAGKDGRLAAGRGLIVANCSPADLLSDDVKPKFERFMKHFGKNVVKDDRIWLGILPRVADGLELDFSNQVDTHDEIDEEPNTEADSAASDDRLLLNRAYQLLSILNDSQVLTFFSFKGQKRNSFSGLTAEYINDCRDKLENAKINYKYSSFAYPNFTIMNERKVTLADEQQIEYGEGTATVEKKELTLLPVYVDACYAAAGITAASQQEDCLLAAGIKQGDIIPGRPFVHVNLEERFLKQKLPTKFNRELSTNWSENIKNAINKDTFGFVFCSDYMEIDGEPVKQAYVYCARSMSKGNKTRQFMPVYCSLVENYISAALKQLNANTCKVINNDFIKQVVEGKWKNDIANHPKGINRMITENESIAWENNKIKISFGENEIYFNTFEIVSEEGK